MYKHEVKHNLVLKLVSYIHLNVINNVVIFQTTIFMTMTSHNNGISFISSVLLNNIIGMSQLKSINNKDKQLISDRQHSNEISVSTSMHRNHI